MTTTPSTPSTPSTTVHTVHTVVHDPLRDEVLLRLAGPVVLPLGSLVELPDGTAATVSAVRLDARDGGKPAVVVQVTRPYPPSPRTP